MTKSLTRERTRSLIKRSQSGERGARDRLVQSNLGLVSAIVRRFSHAGSYDDLFQSGCIGLIKAIDAFDLDYDVMLSTYAVPYIIGEIKKFIREDRSVKVSRSLFSMSREVSTARETLTHELGRSPTASEVSRRVNLSEEDVISALDVSARPASIDAPIKGTDGASFTLADRLPAEKDAVELTERLTLIQLLKMLTEEERRLIFLRYYKRLSQAETADYLQISQPTVSRMEKRVRARLQSYWRV